MSNLSNFINNNDFDSDIIVNGEILNDLSYWICQLTSAGGVTNVPASTVNTVADGWVQIARIYLGNSNPGTRYRHIKFNKISNSAMMYFFLEGYGYSYGNIDCKMGLYMYSNNSILNKHKTQSGTSINFYDAYCASDGKLVLILDLGSTAYTVAHAKLYCQGHGAYNYTRDNLFIESITSSDSVTAQY